MRQITDFLPENVSNEFNDFIENEKTLIIGLISLFSLLLVFPFIYQIALFYYIKDFNPVIPLILTLVLICSLVIIILMGWWRVKGVLLESLRYNKQNIIIILIIFIFLVGLSIPIVSRLVYQISIISSLVDYGTALQAVIPLIGNFLLICSLPTIVLIGRWTINHVFLESFKKNRKYFVVGIISVLLVCLLIPIVYQISLAFQLIDFTDALQVVILGAVLSSLYAVLAIGFSLIYGVAKMFKLSLGGYFVIGAYAMYFLLETVKIKFSFSLLNSLDGIILLILTVLPVIVILVLLVFLRREINGKYLLVIFFAVIISILGIIIGFHGIVASLYAGASTILIAGALWYLELPTKSVSMGALVYGLVILMMSALKLPAVYISLMFIVIIITALIAMIIDRYLLDQVRTSHINTMIVTFSIALLIQSIIQLLYFPENGNSLAQFGPEDRSLQSIIPKASINIFGALIDNVRLISLVASLIACFLLYSFIWFSKMGVALRAVSQDEEAAALTGVDIRKMTAIVSGIGMGLVAFAAALTSSFSARPLWTPFMGWSVLIMAISVVTLGGMGSVPGSIIAAFIIGYVEVIITSIPEYANYSVVVPFICIILVLIFKPEGLMGRKKELEG
ncbi:MAG: branched-chain amino acid ABC transporter permease [Candidatus Hodarchaeales archaeon]|jgi:branched-chain amino acid transport system permease protein